MQCKCSIPFSCYYPIRPLIITNFVCNRLDRKMMGIAKRFGLTYSRYADDITFSGYRPVYDKSFFGELNRIIKKEDFKLKFSKTRIQSKNSRQEVTGVVVNDKLNVNRKYIRNLRAMIHSYNNDKKVTYDGENICDNPKNLILGKLEFLKMIKGKERVYKNLMNRFNQMK